MGCPDSSEEVAAAVSAPSSFYPIGTPGKPWTEVERAQWKSQTKIQRSYREEVLKKLVKFNNDYLEVVQYGSLSRDPQRYPLLSVKTRHWQPNKPCLLVTGGVHGYETSGVQGAILFLEKHSMKYSQYVNMVVAPCVSPWAYEHIQRWNSDLKDPNRSFNQGVETEESKALITYIENLNVDKWMCHLDLHETTDSDATEFMPAKHAEAGLIYTPEVIPDGFYLVGDSENPQLEFLKAVIGSVQKVSHIALPDDNGNIIDEPVMTEGVILVPAKKLGLCCSMTRGRYVATTEVYPDSPRATEDVCNHAQAAAITGALDYVLSLSETDK